MNCEHTAGICDHLICERKSAKQAEDLRMVRAADAEISYVTAIADILYVDSRIARLASIPVLRIAAGYDSLLRDCDHSTGRCVHESPFITSEEIDVLVMGDENGETDETVVTKFPNLSSAIMYLVAGVLIEGRPNWSKVICRSEYSVADGSLFITPDPLPIWTPKTERG